MNTQNNLPIHIVVITAMILGFSLYQYWVSQRKKLKNATEVYLDNDIKKSKSEIERDQTSLVSVVNRFIKKWDGIIPKDALSNAISRITSHN